MSTVGNSTPPNRVYVVDSDGVRGWIDDAGQSASATALSHVSVCTEDGPALLVARELLKILTHNTYAIPVSFAQLRAGHRGPLSDETLRAATARREGDTAAQPAALVLPVLREQLVVSKRPAVVGRVRITKRVHSREEVVHDTVQVERTHVERVPINRVVETAPGIRYEGDTMVISVVEEVLVVEKRLMLREELRVSRQQLVQPVRETVVVRSEEVTVERFPGTPLKPEAERL